MVTATRQLLSAEFGMTGTGHCSSTDIVRVADVVKYDGQDPPFSEGVSLKPVNNLSPVSFGDMIMYVGMHARDSQRLRENLLAEDVGPFNRHLYGKGLVQGGENSGTGHVGGSGGSQPATSKPTGSGRMRK